MNNFPHNGHPSRLGLKNKTFQVVVGAQRAQIKRIRERQTSREVEGNCGVAGFENLAWCADRYS